MHMKAKPPIFVPDVYRAEIEKLSKAALMDLVWDFATTDVPMNHSRPPDAADIMKALRARADIILTHRATE